MTIANKISIKKSKEDNTVDFSFIDTSNNDVVGHLKYDINGKEKTAFIHDTYLFPEYREKGILKNFIDDILCDIKCQGADTATLHILTDEAKDAWKKLGFIELEKKGDMGIDLFTKKCRCNNNKLLR